MTEQTREESIAKEIQEAWNEGNRGETFGAFLTRAARRIIALDQAEIERLKAEIKAGAVMLDGIHRRLFTAKAGMAEILHDWLICPSCGSCAIVEGGRVVCPSCGSKSALLVES